MKSRKAKLRIKKDLEWGEYIVEWVDPDGKVNEDRSNYIGGLDEPYAVDAVASIKAMEREANSKGFPVEISQDKKTQTLIARYSR